MRLDSKINNEREKKTRTQKLEEVEDFYKRNQVREIDKEIGKTRAFKIDDILICKKKDENLSVRPMERLNSWAEYFREKLNGDQEGELNEKSEEELMKG